jgi:hypothetical protein
MGQAADRPCRIDVLTPEFCMKINLNLQKKYF